MPVTTFSRKFPAYHKNAGLPTYFVEQILRGLGIRFEYSVYLEQLFELNKARLDDKKCKLTKGHITSFFSSLNNDEEGVKLHTIRTGNRYRVGDTFSPRVWCGAPYDAPQVQFAPDLKVLRDYEYELINGLCLLNKVAVDFHVQLQIIKNDGFYGGRSGSDNFFGWFKQPDRDFSGQIIGWSDKLSYIN